MATVEAEQASAMAESEDGEPPSAEDEIGRLLRERAQARLEEVAAGG